MPPAPSHLHVTAGFYPVAALPVAFHFLRKDSPVRVGFSPGFKAESYICLPVETEGTGAGVGGVAGLLGDSPACSCE